MLLSSLRSQNPALSVLRRAIGSGQFPNAYLFEGPPGVGKRSAAIGLALAVLCEAAPGEGCAACHTCQRILAGNHPDARVFAPRDEGKRNIQVETLRSDVLRVAQFAPFEGPRAFFIFRDADVSFPEQHPESSNALLKTLEEPKPGLTFVLISERPERLLVTIRSRCQRLRFGRLPPLVIEQILEREGVPREQWDGAIALSDGRADRALALAEGGLGGELVEQALRIDEQLALGDIGRLVELSEALSKRDDLPLVLETMAALYRDVAVVAADGRRDLCVLPAARELVERRAAALGLAGAAARVSALAAVPELLAKNANPQVVLDHLLTSLRG